MACCPSSGRTGLNEQVVACDERHGASEHVVVSDDLQETVAMLQQSLSHVDERLRLLENLCGPSSLEFGQSVLDRLATLESSTAFLESPVKEHASKDRAATEGVAGVVQATEVQPSEGKDVAIAEDPSDKPRKEESTKSKESSVLWQEVQTETRREYIIEENVYGLIVMPGRPLRFGAWLLLLVHYSLVAGLSWQIYQATAKESQETTDSLDELCEPDGDSWDCSQPDLRRLTDFASLDTDGNGLWSLGEARAEGLLWQFNELHKIAVESKDVLRLAAPPQSYVPNIFCKVTWQTLKYAIFLAGENFTEDIMAEFTHVTFGMGDSVEQAKDFLWREALQLSEDDLESCPLEWGAFGDRDVKNTPLGKWLCFVEFTCAEVPGTPAVSSETKYMNATQYYSSFPKAIYEVIFENLLTPCFLLDKHLCHNAEIGSHYTRMVPRWRDLDIAERVIQCTSHVEKVCPHIMGDRFKTFVKESSKTCGERSYETETLPAHTESKAHGTSCSDQDTLLPNQWHRIKNADFGLELLIARFLNRSDLKLLPFHCEKVYELGWCSATATLLLQEPDGSPLSISIGDWLASICPDTCCKQVPMWEGLNAIPISCNARCYQASKHGDVSNPINQNVVGLSRDCFGPGCTRLHVKEEGFGNLRISFAPISFTPDYDALKITIKGTRSVHVNVLRVFSGGDKSCIENSLQIDGTSVCGENLEDNEQVYVPLRGRGMFEIRFIPTHHCMGDEKAAALSGGRSRCQWEVMIADAGERDEYTVSEVAFETQIAFGTSTAGKRSFNFASFFSLILVVWIGFMCGESTQIKKLAYFVTESPDVGQSGPFSPLVERLIFSLLVLLPRLVIWGWVLGVGVMLLAATSEFVEIVLNSVALAFILDIDEYLFAVVVPGSVKKKLIEDGHYEWPAKHRKAFADCEVFIVVGLMLAFVGGIVVFEYFKEGGFLETATRIDCVCLLQGSKCKSGILN